MFTLEGALEVFPDELFQLSIPQWRILLSFAYDGPSTMYQITGKYGFQYPAVHRATTALAKRQWIALKAEQPSQKGGIKKVYALTLLGLLHLLSRVPKMFALTSRCQHSGVPLPKDVTADLSALRTQEDVMLHLLYGVKYDQIAPNHQSMLPLIFGKWTHFQESEVRRRVFSSMVAVAHVTLGHYYSVSEEQRTPLRTLFTRKVYYNLLKDAMFEKSPSTRPGEEAYDYHHAILRQTIAVFKGDHELTKLFRHISRQLESEVTSLSRSLKRLKDGILQGTEKKGEFEG
jgi:hypothetical protein